MFICCTEYIPLSYCELWENATETGSVFVGLLYLKFKVYFVVFVSAGSY